MKQRFSSARVVGYGTAEETEVHCDQGYLIAIGECPNGHGEMEANESGQHCGVCNFSTNVRPGKGEDALAQRMAPGQWGMFMCDRPGLSIQVRDGTAFPKEATEFPVGFTEPFDSQQHAHAEICLEAMRVASVSKLSPSEMHRLLVLIRRYFLNLWLEEESPGDDLRSLFDLVIKHSAKKRSRKS